MIVVSRWFGIDPGMSSPPYPYLRVSRWSN
jgi:hypothetical protein